MARSKKKPVRRRDSTNPNTVLIIFLVFFVLATLGLGGWAWSLNSERHVWSKKEKDATDKVTGLQKAMDWYRGQSYDMRAALGDKTFQDEKSDEYNELKLFREALAEENSKYKEQKEFAAVVQLVAENDKLLGWDKTTILYKKSYSKRLEESLTARKTAEEAYQKARADHQNEKQKFLSVSAQYAQLEKNLETLIKKGNDDALAAAKAKYEEMTNEIKRNKDLETNIEDLHVKHTNEQRLLNIKIAELTKQVQEGGGDPVFAKGPKRDLADPHSLLLDISKGKPLWDVPRGKITRIDERERRVYIDRGFDHGVKPGLTFNIFGAGWDGRAEGALKATIEVIRVLGGNASVARITSLYDLTGSEVSLNDPTPNKILREASNPMKDGDLLYNLVWGARVAVAGIVDLSSRTTDSPAAQMDSLDQFLRVIEKQGAIVEAYLDLRDGKIRGKIGPKTNFLIRGPLPIDEKNPKSERLQYLQDSMRTMSKDAVDRGMFVISPDNFTIVIGYRPHRSATDAEVNDFRPFLPTAGQGFLGLKTGDEPKNGKAPEK